jgi:hypothetical protein
MEVGRRSLFRTREMTCDVPGLGPNLSLVLVHYVVGEIFLWQMSHKPVSGLAP